MSLDTQSSARKQEPSGSISILCKQQENCGRHASFQQARPKWVVQLESRLEIRHKLVHLPFVSLYGGLEKRPGILSQAVLNPPHG